MTKASQPAYKTSLRWRIILVLGLIVTVTSALFAYGVLQMKEQLEEVIFDDMVRGQLEELLQQVDHQTYDDSKLFRDWAFHYGDAAADAHPALRALGPGSHHSVFIDDRYYQVEVGSHGGQPVYLTYDITGWEQQEHELLELLAWGIGLLAIVAVILGSQASRTILAPVKALTDRLSSIHPRERNLRISGEFAGNEIGQIATAFDTYLERLDQFVDRERSFTAAASHELRTPLSVMMGAIDILDAQPQPPASQRALARLKRACGEMRAFIEATLFLSREDSTTIHDEPKAHLPEIIMGLLEDNQPQLTERSITVTTDVPDSLVLTQPASLVQIMLGNILRNAIEHTRNGNIVIVASDSEVTVRDTGTGIPAADLPHIFERSYTTKKDGLGLGLNLVKRICDRFGWQINIASTVGEGTTTIIRF